MKSLLLFKAYIKELKPKKYSYNRPLMNFLMKEVEN